jgi:hypothetical protein
MTQENKKPTLMELQEMYSLCFKGRELPDLITTPYGYMCKDETTVPYTIKIYDYSGNKLSGIDYDEALDKITKMFQGGPCEK